MTNTLTKLFFGENVLKDFDRFLVGYDKQFHDLAKFHNDLMTKRPSDPLPTYPPYNIRKTGDNTYLIEMAVAGFSKTEIEIECEGDKLHIRGATKDADQENWLYKGIGMRNFTRTFALNENIEIKGAALINGMLQVALEYIIPEHKKPKKIQVEDSLATKSDRQLLTEGDKDAK